MRTLGADVKPGDFAENILTRGLDLKGLPVGTVLRAGTAELVVTQIARRATTTARSAGSRASA